MSIPHIRNMKDAYAEIKAADPKTAISFYWFRRTVLSGKIPSFRDGSRILLNMAHVFEYYSSTDDFSEKEQTGQMRPIEE